MPVRLDAWIDFTCPFCFLATLTLERLHQETPVELRWRSYQLRRTGAAPLSPEARSVIEKECVRAAEIARSQHGITLRPGPIGISTRAAHIAAKFAGSYRKADQFHFAAMKAYWLEGRSLEDQKVLQEIAEQVELDRAGLLRSLDDPSFVSAVDADLAQAASREISGVPAVIFDGKYIVAGAQPYSAFKKVLEQVRAQAREAEFRYAQRHAQAGD